MGAMQGAGDTIEQECLECEYKGTNLCDLVVRTQVLCDGTEYELRLAVGHTLREPQSRELMR